MNIFENFLQCRLILLMRSTWAPFRENCSVRIFGLYIWSCNKPTSCGSAACLFWKLWLFRGHVVEWLQDSCWSAPSWDPGALSWTRTSPNALCGSDLCFLQQAWAFGSNHLLFHVYLGSTDSGLLHHSSWTVPLQKASEPLPKVTQICLV